MHTQKNQALFSTQAPIIILQFNKNIHFQFADMLFHKCSYPIDQGAKQLFPSMCIVWCHGHYVSTIVVVTQLWRKFCQTPKDTEDLKWELKICLLSVWFSIGNVQVVHEKQLQGYHGIGFLKHNSFLEYYELKEMVIVHFLKITKDENYLSYLAFPNSVFRATLNPHLPLVFGMYN